MGSQVAGVQTRQDHCRACPRSGGGQTCHRSTVGGCTERLQKSTAYIRSLEKSKTRLTGEAEALACQTERELVELSITPSWREQSLNLGIHQPSASKSRKSEWIFSDGYANDGWASGGFNALKGWAVQEIIRDVYSRFYYHLFC